MLFEALAALLEDAASHDGIVSKHLWFPWIHTDASVVVLASPTCSSVRAPLVEKCLIQLM